MSGHDGPADDPPADSTQAEASAPLPELSPDQLAVLNIIAEHEVSTARDISGDRLHRDSGGLDDAQKDGLAVVQQLSPRYIECVRPLPYDGYWLTAEGWLRSQYADDIRDLVAGTLALLYGKLAGDPDFDRFTWEELKPRLINGSVISHELARLLLVQFEVSPSAPPNLFVRPADARTLARLRTLDNLLRHRELERAAKWAEEEKTAAAWREALGSSNASGILDDFGLFSPPAVNLHFHPGSKVETTHNANISNANIGAFSQGGGAQATAGPGARVADRPPTHEDPTSVPTADPGQDTGRPPAVASYSAQIQDSTLAAHAQGPGSRAVGIVQNYGLGYADVREIADERVALALDRLREAVGQAHSRSMEDMLRVSFAVVQSLLAAKLGTPPDAASVAEFLRAALEDPAFPARAARLFQEGAKAPSAARREMLARALFGIPATTPERDRVDAAIERLFPDDVRLLQALLALVKRSEKDYIVLIKAGSPVKTYAVLPGNEHSDPASVEHLVCPEWPLCSLQVVGCVRFGPWAAALGPDHQHHGTGLGSHPLGYAVLSALEGAGFDGFGE
jgi:hypothetical protein